MLDEKEEKRQKRNVKLSVMLMICAVIIAYEYNLHRLCYSGLHIM